MPFTADTGTSALAYEGHRIRHRGGMLNLTDMWTAAGRPDHRRPSDWLLLEDTNRFRTGALAEQDEALLPQSPDADDVGVWVIERDGLIASRQGSRGSTWAHWQLALSYGQYLSPAFHAWCNTALRAAMARSDRDGLAGTAALHRSIARQFQAMNRRLDALERHVRDGLFLQLSAQDLLMGRRRHFTGRSQGLMLAVLRDPPYEGLCPCCGVHPVLDAVGERLPGAEYDHAFHRGLNRPEHGWLICGACHQDLTSGGYLVRFERSGAFHAFQAAVSARRRRPGTVTEDTAF
ncbi:KilA-N domain-containing protein [Muricoccus pecuniae]|uniref:KilA/APSES-type HTH DNA-binding domain-containing protein n=1 Tax=Muricoccus pecuniae TaxID=693023 RepID=A0A840YMD9_9PROT|nr:KilA-N domain-containing protein [Roseomonas pecuniae]MBB5696512.1 hypothetical protein [Roseomonas pecuniae]